MLYNEYLERLQNNPEDNSNSNSQENESPRNDSDSESLTTEETSGEEEIQLVASIQSDSADADAQGILESN